MPTPDDPNLLVSQARELRAELTAQEKVSEAQWDRVERGLDDVVWQRLEDQLSWYDEKAVYAQRRYKRLDAVTFSASVATVATLGMGGPRWTSILTASLVVLAIGFQRLNGDEQHWLTYRATAEALKHEKYLYLAGAGPYENATNAKRVLMERTEGLVSQEHAQWTDARSTSSPR